MADVLAALKRAEYDACYEFCRRQKRENLPALVAGANALRRVVHHLQCQHPDKLMRWKFPDTYDPIPGDALPRALDAACEDDTDRVYAALGDLGFGHLAACGSAAAHLQRAASHLILYGHRNTQPDRQARLFE